MSNKNLLNEAQIRQFMKLAKLEPLTPGFVHGLTEKQGADDREDEHLGAEDGAESGKKQSEKDRRKEMRGERRAKGESGDPVPTQEGAEEELDEVRTGVDPTPNLGSARRGHGRGRTGEDRLEEQPEDELPGMEAEIGNDEAAEEVEVDAELPLPDEGEVGDAGGRMVSVDDFLAALETALETAMGDEVEIEDEEAVEDEEVEDVDALGPPPEEEEIEVSAEEELEEATTLASDDLVERITKRVAARILKSALVK